MRTPSDNTTAPGDLGALDFPPARTAVRIREIIEKLSVSEGLIEKLIDSGELITVDISAGALKRRRSKRVTVESYRAFLRRRLSATSEALGQ